MEPRLLGLAGLVLLGVGCVAGVDGGEADASGAGTSGKADGETGESAAPPPSLAPGYVVNFDSTVERRRSDGEIETYEAGFLGWASAEQDGTSARFTVHACAARLPRIGGHQPVLEASAVRSASPVLVEGRLVRDDNGRWRLASDTAALTLGVRLDNPVDDALPTDRRDSRVVDADEDGFPGVSLRVSIFSVYVGLRATFWLEGDLVESGGIAGEPELGVDFAVYGDSVPFFDARAELAERRDTPTGISHRDRLTMTPLSTTTPSCP